MIYKPPQLLREDKSIGNIPRYKNPGETGENNEPNKHRNLNSSKMPVLNEYLIIGGAFFLPTQEDDVNMPHGKSPGGTGENSKPKNIRSPIHPRSQSLLKMIFLVTNLFYYPNNMSQMTLLVAHFFYYLNNMAKISGYIFLQ